MGILKKITGIITDDPREQHNLCCYGGSAIIRTAYVRLGTLANPFYFALGLSTSQMGLLGTPGLAIGIATMILSTAFLDRIRNRARCCALMQLCGASLSPLLILLLSLIPPLRDNRTAFYLIFATAIVSVPITANFGAVDAMLFSRSIKPDHRGKYFGLVGIIGGLVGVGCSLFATWEFKTVGFPFAFSIIYSLMLLLIVISGTLKWRTRELPELVGTDIARRISPWENLKKVVRMKEFALLMPANVMRGFGDGAGNYAVIVGMRDIGLPLEVAGYAIVISSLSSLTANAAIGKLADRLGAGRMILPTVLVLCAGLIGMVNSTSAWMFLGFYLLWNVMQLMEATEIPLVHYDVVPVEAMGAFSSIRLLCLSLTMQLSGIAVGFSLDHFPAWTIFAVCAGLKIVAALLFAYGSAAALRHKHRMLDNAQ